MKYIITLLFTLNVLTVSAQDVKIQGPKKTQSTNAGNGKRTNNVNSESKKKKIPQSTNAGNGKRTNNVNSESKKKKILSELANNMVYVEGGTYMMGNNYEGEQFKSIPPVDYPAHSVTVKSFYICKYEVTQELWQAVMGKNPSGSWGNTQSQVKGGKKPVVNVNRHDCMEFISKLNMLTGKLYRLPKEDEWEYAARGGSKSNGYKYSGSNSWNSVAWFKDNSGGLLHEVGQKAPNELGLYDMSGNVMEWCSDKWYYYSNRQLLMYDIGCGICRGGSWNCLEEEISIRSEHELDNDRRDDTGLRLAISPEDQ